jgi:DNA (cytosine-5)-methyltransferase 1
VDTTKELPTVIAFCAGYGGIERGLDLAGVEHRVIAYVEIEAFAIANLVSKMEAGLLPPAPIYTDIKTFPAEVFRDRVDIITGGYPCQPFSAAGKRKGTDDPRHLWPYIRRHIESIRPVQCFFENVEGHISLGLSTVVSDLEEDGYRTTWGIFSAREVGAPHQRKRVFILAYGKGQFSKRGISERGSERKSEEAVGSGGACSRKPVNAQSKRPQQSLVWGEVKGCSGDWGKDVANSISQRLQGGKWLRGDSCQDKGGKDGANGAVTERCNDSQQGQWPPEPRVGRVVDGCPDRVDRIRLLGNAVVPQTAAKAYKTLMRRM